MNEPNRRWWDGKTADAEVIDKAGRSEPLSEWGSRNPTWSGPASEYRRIFNSEKVISRTEAQVMVKEIQKELKQERPSTPSRTL